MSPGVCHALDKFLLYVTLPSVLDESCCMSRPPRSRMNSGVCHEHHAQQCGGKKRQQPRPEIQQQSGGIGCVALYEL